ncbi:MAG: AAA family ATPase [Saccharofermentanales bacterium]|jgi:cytidylate kinase|nr:cytidylate kinase-like family protein [Clostridiaceae bacterium]
MKDRIIICVSREYGSGGGLVGKKLAEQLGIKYYDKKLIEKTARDHDLPEEYVAEMDEKPIGWFSAGIQSPYRSDYHDALFYVMNDRVFYLQAETIKSIAAEGSCVIIGRVAEEVLKEDPDMVSVFIHAEKEDRINRVMGNEGFTYKEAERMVRKMDKNRANYHNFYSDRKWGRCESYDFSISTSRFGIDGAVKGIVKLLE